LYGKSDGTKVSDSELQATVDKFVSMINDAKSISINE